MRICRRFGNLGPSSLAGLLWLLAGLPSGPLQAQSYPSRPVRLVTAEVGGGHDFTARLVAQGLGARLGQQFLVENRAGAIIAGDLVAKSPPDGHTLLVFGGSLWVDPLLHAEVPYDFERDFAPIGMVANAPILIAVNQQLPVKSVKELIAMARARPGTLNYASGQVGAGTHLAAELFKFMAGIDIVRIPYKGNGPATNALVAGQVQLMFPTAGAVASLLKNGRIRALGITFARPSALFPDLPTVAAAGELPGYQFDSFIGAFAPARVPPAIVSLLSRELSAALANPEIRQRFAASGVETIGSTPQALAEAVQSERTRLGKLIRDLNLKPD